MGAETIAECVARAQLVAGVTYEQARAGCVPVAKVTRAATAESLTHYWVVLVLGFVLAVVVTFVVSEWAGKEKGKYQR